ncbi:hypothetical protein [Candidatus Poriferisodalis sp.]|uniref:hypothetical protein n=1 Tax=Candidatus Poriferisodalis sp. TaxID=3101277 RepID=UPI003B018654
MSDITESDSVNGKAAFLQHVGLHAEARLWIGPQLDLVQASPKALADPAWQAYPGDKWGAVTSESVPVGTHVLAMIRTSSGKTWDQIMVSVDETWTGSTLRKLTADELRAIFPDELRQLVQRLSKYIQRFQRFA